MFKTNLSSRKVIVVGAGLAGCAAALSAYEIGSSVEVIESRTKESIIESETTSFEALQNLTPDGDALKLISKYGFNIEPEAVYRGAKIYSPSGRSIDFRLLKPHGYFLRRKGKGSIDHQMIDRIEKAGIEIGFGTRVKSASPDGTITMVRGADIIERKADLIIGADGRSTTVGMSITNPIFRNDIAIGIGRHFKGPHGFEPGIAQCWLGNELCPGEYSYVLPTEDEVTVVTTMRPHMVPKGTSYDEYLDRFLALPSIRVGLASTEMVCRLFGSVPVTPGKRFGHGKILLAGESARLTDPLLGFGMKNSILSGHFAGTSTETKDPLGHYEGRIRSRLLPDLEKRMKAREGIMDRLDDGQIERMLSMIGTVLSENDPNGFFDPKTRRRALGSGIWSVTKRGNFIETMKLMIPLVRANFSFGT